jgi:histidine ammonia-lyase
LIFEKKNKSQIKRMHHHEISSQILSLDELQVILSENHTLKLSKSAKKKIQNCRAYLDKKTAQPDVLMYGINTGFGSLCNIRISDNDIEQLQYNLVVSHAVGLGDLVPEEIVRIMLLLKIQSLSYGHSAVRLELIERLIEFYNKGIYPVIFELGSLGASGDLAPLAHLSLPLIGLGEVWYKGKRSDAASVLAKKGITPLRFQAKEALALLNGTQFSTAYGVWNLLEARRLAQMADVNAAIGVDAFDCRLTPFHDLIHQIRPHLGQLFVSTTIRNLLKDSEISAAKKKHVQDPYSFRCVPQVHGASHDALDYISQTLLIEINSVTDNPNVFAEEDLILSGGNFHAQPIALTMDYLAIALSEFGNISERRVFQLISGQRDLPPFLTKNPGLHSGMMIAQYTAAAIVNQNKTLCTPSSADSIVSCNGQEDHVSMAANAATKARRIVLNVERLLAIEFMVAMQALEFRRPARSSDYIEKLHADYRQVVPKLEEDRILSTDIEQTIVHLRGLK